MSGELITVFGGSGFIGRYLVKRLAQRGYRVRVAIRRPDEGLFLKTMGSVGQIDVVQANLRNGPSVARAVAGASGVINCVGILFETGDQTFAAVQARGAGLVAEAAAKAGVKRLVHVSAIGADATSNSGYAAAKAAGEAAVRAAFPAATIIRPSVVFGPEDDFLNRFANLSRFVPVMPLIDGGNTRFQPVYVGDVAEGIANALKDDKAAGQTFEFGGPRTYTFRQIMELVLRETGRFALLVPVPAAAASVPAFFLELAGFWFRPLLTRDQVKLLGRDNVADPAQPGLGALGINPTPMEGTVESYLYRYRRGGARSEPRLG